MSDENQTPCLTADGVPFTLGMTLYLYSGNKDILEIPTSPETHRLMFHLLEGVEAGHWFIYRDPGFLGTDVASLSTTPLNAVLRAVEEARRLRDATIRRCDREIERIMAALANAKATEAVAP